MVKKRFLGLSFLLLVSCATPKTQKDNLAKAEIYYSMGTANLQSKEYTEALVNLLKAAELSPNDSKIFNNLGMAYYFKKDVTLARTFLKKSLALDSGNEDARLNLASIFFEEGDLKNAEVEYKKVLKNLTYDRQFRTYYNLGLIELQNQNKSKAREYFKSAIEVNEEYCPAHFQLGHLFLEEKNYEKALSSFKDASAGICYNQPEPVYYQAITLTKMANPEAARRKLEDIIARFPRHDLATKARLKLAQWDNLSLIEKNEENEAETSETVFLTPNF